jgi:cytochrome c oxidase assembly protein subunit 15
MSAEIPMHDPQRPSLWLFNLTVVMALVLAIGVVALGAYVRLSNAGLGCPDWPTCYGQIKPPAESVTGFSRPLELDKAWKEMVHRYAAASLGVLAMLLVAVSWWRRHHYPQLFHQALFLLVVVVLQGLLGRFTVTWKLMPIVVVAHLVGGFLTISLLLTMLRYPLAGRHYRLMLRPLARLGLLVLIVQILLGGWTSANYAAQVCPDFPTCNGEWWPEHARWDEAFSLRFDTSADYEFGKMSALARVGIHQTHRAGAAITAIVLLLLTLSLFAGGDRPQAWALLGALLLQVGLGIGNVLLQFPLPLAVAHNLGALLLLQVVIWINWPRQAEMSRRMNTDAEWPLLQRELDQGDADWSKVKRED